MPQLIKHIDAICREKQRDVLWVTFVPEGYEKHNTSTEAFSQEDWLKVDDYNSNPNRQSVIDFLENNCISYCPCGNVANENGWTSYQGQIYIDVPFDTESTAYKILESFFENEHGEMIRPGVMFWYLPLEHAMKNKHHDKPEFWEKWADKF